MVDPEWIDREHMRVPSPAIAEGVQGDGLRVIDESDPIFAEWKKFMELKGIQRPSE